ncbi:hypothetical protein MVES1_003671 [Malassezia vespertilionis]|uniref:RRN7-type domain-containing protein n=1 Tax=Malassezia vespertilionis TaxID=2020962 RepID=A0A2N1J8D3_9BASI|nr:uncharacterized protein MVES1_003671 [Malassezia vespertilionis]PKI82808.1 hypothetical protein MVES_003233 [Malassezia vespertilionis]WFD08299.1 hypothetical protein MVES1_003671 [Malassezia vespertilionis]
MAPGRRRCLLCGSTRFQILSSQLVCSSGHLQRDFRIETAQEDDGFGAQITTRTRSLNRASQRASMRAERRRLQLSERRRVRGREGLVRGVQAGEGGVALLHGPRATFAIVQCFQLVLRHQLVALRALYSDIPHEIDGVARELWALHVSSEPLKPAPYLAAQTAQSPDDTKSLSLETLSLRSTIAVLFLALVMCRVPISLGELRGHVHARTLPYLNALQRLPQTLTDTLSNTDITFAALDTDILPSVTELHARIGSIATRLHLHRGLALPEVNAPPILARLVRRMLLPATMYVGAKSLLTFLHIDMHVRNVSVQLPNGTNYAAEPSALNYSRNATVPRCAMLMGALLVMAKLRWGLDGRARHETQSRLGHGMAFSGTPDVQAWINALCCSVGMPEEALETLPKAPFRPWDTSADLLSLTDEDMDAYLAFLESQYTPRNVPRNQPHKLRGNLHDLQSFAEAPKRTAVVDEAQVRSAAWEQNAALYRSLYPVSPHVATDDEVVAAPGDAYPVYSYDPAGTMHRDFCRVVDAANRVLGFDTDPAPQKPHATRRLCDQDLLLDCVMHLDEALITTLLRNRQRGAKQKKGEEGKREGK